MFWYVSWVIFLEESHIDVRNIMAQWKGDLPTQVASSNVAWGNYCMRKLLHNVSGHSTCVWTLAFGPFWKSGAWAYLWVTRPLKNSLGLFGPEFTFELSKKKISYRFLFGHWWIQIMFFPSQSLWSTNVLPFTISMINLNSK